MNATFSINNCPTKARCGTRSFYVGSAIHLTMHMGQGEDFFLSSLNDHSHTGIDITPASTLFLAMKKVIYCVGRLLSKKMRNIYSSSGVNSCPMFQIMQAFNARKPFTGATQTSSPIFFLRAYLKNLKSAIYEK